MKLGILGGGQLGQMLALAGYPLGVVPRFLDPAPDAPAKLVGETITADFNDHAALDRFARGLDAVTFEFENVPVATVEHLSKFVPVFPGPLALRTGQDREQEKSLFTSVGCPVPDYAIVRDAGDLALAHSAVGLPCVMKTLRLGYDGKGQAVVRHTSALDAPSGLLRRAWESLGRVPVIVERLVPFSREVSQIACRGRDGTIEFYPLVQNVHAKGILRVSTTPIDDPGGTLAAQARRGVRAILERLDYVGVLAVEFFAEPTAPGERLLANELAPRVHNSGHWTIEGSLCSQFENHLRAVAGWPLGSAAGTGPCAMVNLIGRPPATRDVLAIPGTNLHLYGKEPREDRKIGHVTLRANSAAELAERARALRALVDAHAPG